MTSVELCPKCHASMALTSHKMSFGEDFVRAYRNPTQSEVSRIASSLANVSSEMADLAQEVARVESILIALKAHHAHLDTFIQRSTQFIRPSPIRRFPTEVLATIFASACTSFQRSEYKTPLSISLVCSKWRDIALSTSSLWTHIYVAPHLDGLDVYNHFLERCGNIPISIKIEIPHKERPKFDCNGDYPYKETYDYHIALVSPIYQHCSQWKVVELCMDQEDVNLLDNGLPTPVLESLAISNDGPANFLLPGLFRSQLREFCFQSDIYDLSQFLNNPKAGDNRTLIFRPRLQDIKLPWLDIAFSLRVSTLVLDSIAWSYSISDFFRAVTIPTLQSLTMIASDPSTTGHFVPTDPFSSLPKFLDRSGCALQTLTLIMRGRYEEGAYIFHPTQRTLTDSLVVALQSMTDLRALRIIEAESGPSLLSEWLFEEMAAGQLVPALTSLELVWAEDRQPVDALISMLNLRCGQGGTGMDILSSVVLGVRNGGDLRGDVLDCMANLRQTGIRATLW